MGKSHESPKRGKWVQVVAAAVEGSSINSVVHLTGVAKHTVLKEIENR